MKNLLSILCMYLFAASALAQNTFPSSGNTGIGTTSPSKTLQVVGQIAAGSNGYGMIQIGRDDGTNTYVESPSNDRNVRLSASDGTNSGSFDVNKNGSYEWFSNGVTKMAITGSGNVGIGTTAPALKFVTRVGSDLNWGITTGTYGLYPALRAMNDAANAFIHAEIDASVLTLNAVSGGNVGIGTTDPQGYKLAVNGKIRAKEIKVETANWPDYVFSKGHSLLSLGDLEKYIQTNKHLPEIPSAEEVKKDGIELGEMNAKLLKKIEELTLYMIEKDRQVSLLEERLKRLENKK